MPPIVVRTRMPDTNLSSGLYVAYSSPPPPEVDIPLKTYGSYTVLSPQSLPDISGVVPRLATLMGRAQWLLGFLIDEMPLPRRLTGRITSENDVIEMRSVMTQYLNGKLDSEIQDFIRTVQLGEMDYYERFLTKRRLLQHYVRLIENPEESELEGVLRSTKAVVCIPEQYANNFYYPIGGGPSKVEAPPGWIIGFFPTGEGDGSILIEPQSGKFVPRGAILNKRFRNSERFIRIRHRLLLSPLDASVFVKEVLQGYLAPEYLPTLLDDPHPLLSFADTVDTKTKLFCISIGAKNLEKIRERLMIFAVENQTGGMLRSVTLFCPTGCLPTPLEVENSLKPLLYDFASRSAMLVPLSLNPVVRESHDKMWHLALLCSTGLFDPILQQRSL